jgi:pantetheine-phosphate adenylyltransferase
MTMRRAIYPGTFDPPHNGHLDVVRRTACLFDEVIVAVYEHPAKSVLFDATQRVELLREALAGEPQVSVAPYRGLTVEYARERAACAIVRGLRATGDFEFEYQLALMNRHLCPEIEGVFLMTSLEYAHVSASLVKEVARLGGDVSGLVPRHVVAALRQKLSS